MPMGVKTSPEIIEKCVKLRLRHPNLSTPQIAKRLKISPHVAYAALVDHPWSRVGFTNKRSWRPEELKIIKEHYLDEDPAEVYRLLPRRTVLSIRKKAFALGLKRNPVRLVDVETHRGGPIAEELVKARIARGLSRHRLAALLGYEDNTVMRWELGRASPTLVMVQNWADGLGYELLLVKKGTQPSAAPKNFSIFSQEEIRRTTEAMAERKRKSSRPIIDDVEEAA